MSKWSPLAVLFLLATFFLSAAAAAQDPDTVFDDADILSASEEREVQEAFDAASAEIRGSTLRVSEGRYERPDDLAAQDSVRPDTVRARSEPP